MKTKEQAALREPIPSRAQAVQQKLVEVDSLHEHPRHAQIYGEETVAESLISSINDKGVITPLIVTDDGVVLSGLIRLLAAKLAGVKKVPVRSVGKLRQSEQLEYLLDSNKQREKTNWQKLQEAVAYREISEEKAKQRMVSGASNKNQGQEPVPDPGQSRDEVGKLLGVSGRQISKMFRVDRAYTGLKEEGRDDEALELLKLMNKSVAKADRSEVVKEFNPKSKTNLPQELPSRIMYRVGEWKKLTEDEQKSILELHDDWKYTMNLQGNDSIEWAQLTWNPITGCLRGCRFCYARDITNRFHEYSFEPYLHPERLVAPYQTPVPEQAKDDPRYRNVFVCSMADLFGSWVPQEWIDKVFEVVRDNPQFQFLFLSKFPRNLVKQDWPSNAQVGTTITIQNDVDLAMHAMRAIKEKCPDTKTWLSIEPMLERLHFESFKAIDQVVIGGASKSSETPAFTPPYQWVKPLLTQIDKDGAEYFLKTNLEFRPNGWMGEGPGEVPDRAPDVFFPQSSVSERSQKESGDDEETQSAIPAHLQLPTI